jgi:hypothetical protein
MNAVRVVDPTPGEWRDAGKLIAAVFVVTRLILVGVAYVATILPGETVLDAWDSRPVIAALTGFDSVYYLGIAEEGYHLEPIHGDHHDWAFFPAFPVVIRIASVMTAGDLAVAGILVSNVAFLLALFVIYRLGRIYLDHQTSLRAVAYLTIAPGAVAFAMAYSDSLFLLLASGAFLAAERGRWVAMGLLLALATLTRLPGLFLVVPLAILFWQRSPAPRRAYAWLVAAPVALGLFCAFQGATLGDPVAFLTAQGSWNFTADELTPPTGGSGGVGPVDLIPLVLTIVWVGYIFLLVYARVDRIPLAYVVLAITNLMLVAASLRLLSLPRYLVVAWPFDWLLAGRTASWFQAAWPIASTGLMALFALLHFVGVLAP